MYQNVNSPIVKTDILTAEMVKYISNTFHALKITFANEIGNLCKAHDIDGQKVMEIVCSDHHLNISSTYLRPGFAFGGSCLPKDVRALVYRAKERDVETPLLNAILPSNQKQIQRGIDLVETTGRHKIGILGLSFKSYTDDVRESPTIVLIETLIGRGYDISIYDEYVDPSRLIGANRVYLERGLPHIASLMKTSIDDVVNNSEVVLITNGSSNFRQVSKLMRSDQVLIDLDGIAKDDNFSQGSYEGICW
jgi:GDP-mannose 6-dehydrogenase